MSSSSSSDSDYRRRRNRRREITRSDGQKSRSPSMDRFNPRRGSASDSDDSYDSSERRNDRHVSRRDDVTNGDKSRRFGNRSRVEGKEKDDSEDEDGGRKGKKVEDARKRNSEDRSEEESEDSESGRRRRIVEDSKKRKDRKDGSEDSDSRPKGKLVEDAKKQKGIGFDEKDESEDEDGGRKGKRVEDARKRDSKDRSVGQDRGFDKKDAVSSKSEDEGSWRKGNKAGARKRDLEDGERRDDRNLKGNDSDLSRDQRSGKDGEKTMGGEKNRGYVAKERGRERIRDDEDERREMGRGRMRESNRDRVRGSPRREERERKRDRGRVDDGDSDGKRETRRESDRKRMRGSPRREERESNQDRVREDEGDNDGLREMRRESDRKRVRGSPGREEGEIDQDGARNNEENNDRNREARRERNRDRVRESPTRRVDRETNRDRAREDDEDNDRKREMRESPNREEKVSNRDRVRDDYRDNNRNRETRRESNRDRVQGSPRRDERERRRNPRDKLSESPPRQERDRGNQYRDERRKEGTAEEQQKSKLKEVSVPMPDPKAGKTGGAYIPPFKLARMLGEVQDKSSNEYQRLSWDALRKSINGLVNKVNATNIKNIIPELFSENMIRGRGLFCRSCMKSQMASPGFTDVFAALAAVVNTKFPDVGRLLLVRIVLQLKRAYKRNDKPQLLAATKFVAHLVNQLVAHEIIALELLTVLLQEPTDDSVEVAVGFVKECGALLQDISPQGLHGIFERFRGILHEGEIDKRVQFLIEGLFAIRKAKFQGFPAIRPELDLVEQEDQFTHEVSLDEEIDPETNLDIFKPNPNFIEDEKAYENFKTSILGAESSEDEEGSDAGSDDEDEDGDEDSEEDEEQMKIKDETETNLVNLRRTIYLTIMSSVDFEEAGHKLLKIKLEPGQEMELCIMLLECCSQERTYLRYYGLLGQRFCMINKVHQENFEKCFVQQYSMIHRLETNKLRNVAKFFAHLLGTDALPWHVLAYIRLTEEDTTSSSRIFIKILFQELSEHLGIRLLNERLNDPIMKDSFDSIFPKDNPKNTRFAINFFTSIGLGGITESLREYLKNMPRLIMQQQQPVKSDSESSESSSSSSSESSGESDSESETESSSSDSEDRRQRSKKQRTR